jgi:hypothetical protein
MHAPYSKPVIQAFPDPVKHIPKPYISKFMVFIAKGLGRLYLFLFLGIARIVLWDGKQFFDAFDRALRGKSRVILAFRHANGGEPQILFWFICYRLKHLAAKAGVHFNIQPHVLFVYGYEVVRWGGWIARMVMPRLGAMPVYHTKLDLDSMKEIYRKIINSPYPLAIAPEGQISYVMEAIPRLEQGTMRIGFYAAERISHAGQTCPVEVLPVSIHFHYGRWGFLRLQSLLKKIEKYTGFKDSPEQRKFPALTERFRVCRDHLIRVNEKRYNIKTDESLDFSERLDRIVDCALDHAERSLGIKPFMGDIISRVYHVRQICWDRIFLPGKETLEGLPPVERALLDLQAGEAWHAARHMELADLVWYLRSPLPTAETLLDETLEYAQNLWDFANRTMGGAYSTRRTNIFPRRVIIQTAAPINLTERLPEFHQDKKAAINKAICDLKDAYLDCNRAVKKNYGM